MIDNHGWKETKHSIVQCENWIYVYVWGLVKYAAKSHFPYLFLDHYYYLKNDLDILLKAWSTVEVVSLILSCEVTLQLLFNSSRWVSELVFSCEVHCFFPAPRSMPALGLARVHAHVTQQWGLWQVCCSRITRAVSPEHGNNCLHYPNKAFWLWNTLLSRYRVINRSL